MGVRKKTKSHIKRPKGKGSANNHGGVEDEIQANLVLKEQIWQIVSMIPKGHVASYGQIAKLCGFPSHARFVGRTLGNLPKGSKLPWFRVVNSQRKISLRGGGEAKQRKLLEAEGVTFIGDRIAKGHLWQAQGD